jgi:hypothetical protein
MSTYLSPLVTCIACRQVKSSKGIFSHFIIAHTDGGRESAINRGKIGGAASREHSNNAKNNREMAYTNNPKKCKQCDQILGYAERRKQFCSHSCSAIYNNNKRLASGYVASEKQRESARLRAQKIRLAKKILMMLLQNLLKFLNAKCVISFFPYLQE